ncbi:hypothetical protein DDB_G0267212 [Dictyostelium discoideum AX4]|uniref:Reverse transcriptase domain-containing protein n=1 Tax=Dictyostelium discoideum TaxID=44689 RepID=Q55H52_DICDI|nr:hypothetical protein DDB_G0267212 [Dictyostelium discoideum AX4]EAL73843.1 hypothetical protein DDB_G0267212 [Dictyostelium discoideum AX4]|eukprot:XP_647767.1 hypothetical protein DDB_G0267212 [Dictyostelium discoideum AX4]
MSRNQLTQVVITLQETVVIVNPVVGVMADLTTSMDHQVMLHQVATIPSLPTVPTTVFRRTRSKLTSMWTSVPPQTSLERIGSSKLLSRGRKWIKSPSTSKFQADAKPNSDFNSRGSKIRLYHKGSTRLVIRRCHRTSTSKLLFKTRFLLQRVYGSKTWDESTSSSSRFKKVKHLHQQPIIQEGRNQESTINGQTRLLHGKTRYQESLPPRISRSTIQRLIPLRVERFTLPLENNAVRVIDSSSYLYNAVKTCTFLNTRDLFRFVWKGSHYRWKTMPFGLSTAPRIFTMLLRPLLRMLRDINVSVIAYLDDLLIVGSTKEECISNLKKTIDLLVKLGFKLNLEKSVLEPTQSITLLLPKKACWFKRKVNRTERCSHPIQTLHSSNKQVFMDYLTRLFKHKPPLAFSTINGHRSVLNQLLLLRNQTDIVNDPFISRIMTNIHKLRPSSAKYKEIWDANQVFKHLSTIKVIPKYTYTALLNKTFVLCKMFGLARSPDLFKWSFKGLIITPDSIKGPVINAKEQRNGVVSILELTSLDDTNSQVCPNVIEHSKNKKFSKEKMKSMEDQINNLSLAFTRFMKEPMFYSNKNSRSQPSHDNSDTENEQSEDESSNNFDVSTDYQLSDTLLGQYKHMVNNQGLLVEEECILKKDEISELNKVFNFPSNFQVNVAPFITLEGVNIEVEDIIYFSY